MGRRCCPSFRLLKIVIGEPRSAGPVAERRIETCGIPEVARWREWHPEGERLGCGTTFLEEPKTVLRFCDGWNVSGGNPPEHQDGPLEALEPLLSVTQHADVTALVHELLERFERLPHRHVDRYALVLVRPDRRRVAIFGLESPHESRSLVGECVDRIELRPKTFHARVVERRPEPANVELCEMETGQGFFSSVEVSSGRAATCRADSGHRSQRLLARGRRAVRAT